MSIEIGSKWVKDGVMVEVIEVFLYKDAFYVVDFKYKNGKKESQCGILTQVDFLEQYKPYEVVYEYEFIAQQPNGDRQYTNFMTEKEM